MRIGITGTHSTGKTTLVEALRTEPHFKDYFFDINVTRWINNLGLPINKDTNDASQEINLIKRIAHLNSFDKMICDRTIIDVIAYSSHGENISERSIEYQNKLFNANIAKYDRIYYLPPDIELIDDGIRIVDPEYRNKIDKTIQDILSFVDSGVRVLTVRGSIRERVQMILEDINAD